MGFQNEITGGQGALERTQIKSPNFVAGSTGWSINRNGSAEFNSVTVRGALIVGSDELFYSGPPAFGNLAFSISAHGGTDSFGNVYPAGLNVAGGNLAEFAGPLTSTTVITAAVFADSFARFIINADGTLGWGGGSSPTDVALFRSVAGTLSCSGNLQISSNGLVAGDVIKTISGSAVTWQTPSYGTNWASSTTFNGNTYHALQYRLDAEDNVLIAGTFKAGSSIPSNPVFTLPSAYRPAGPQPLWAQRNSGGTVTSGHIYVGSSGNVNVITGSGLGIAANDEFICSGVIPLNNIP